MDGEWSIAWLTLLLLGLIGNVRAADVSTTPSYAQLLTLYKDEMTCSDAGFRGAFLNECGFCVQGMTGLDRDYGRDCSGACGRAYVDCAGRCNGQAYVDECDGSCIEVGANGLDARNALGPSSPTSSSLLARDCRGLCPLRTNLSEEVNSTWPLFENDGCGICKTRSEENTQRSSVVVPRPQVVQLNQTKNSTSRVFPNGTTSERRDVPAFDDLPPSEYRDCSGTCFTPATVHLMAVNTSDTCFQCWGPKSSSLGFLDLRDECGHCRKDHIPCYCPLAFQDLCGVCNGTNDTCVTIVSASPTVIPSETRTKVSLMGVALKNRHSTVCMLIRKDIGADGKDEDRFPAVVIGQNISCDVTLPQGVYELRLAVINTVDDQLLDMSNTSVPFIVYSKSALFNRVSPSSISVDVNATNFTLEVYGQDLDRLKTVYCGIEGDGFEEAVRVESSSVNDSMVNCTFPMPSKSFTANVSISLDNNSSLAGPFSIDFIAPAPMVIYDYIFPDGDSVAIYFNRDVNVSAFKDGDCSGYLSSATVHMLTTNSSCHWVTKRQLLINLSPEAGGVLAHATLDNSNVNETALVISFQDNVLKTNNETFTEMAEGFERSFTMADEVPVAVLSGPNHVPNCGKFTLDAHQSIRIQSRRVSYLWSVADTQGSNLTTQAMREVIQEANDQGNVAYISLDTEMLEPEVTYEFTLLIYNAESQSNNDSFSSNVAKLNVTKSYLLLPAVIIEPSLANYPSAVTVDQSFTLYSHVTTPTCQHEIFALTYNWTISNPRVKVDLQQINKDSYTIAPYTLPAGENVTFTLVVTLNNDVNLSSNASVTVSPSPSGIRAVIDGGIRRVIGNESGVLRLNASRSYYADLPSLPLVFRWECIQEDGEPCYDYDVNGNSVFLVPQPITRNPVLSLLSRKFRADRSVNFTLTVFSPLNPSVVSEPSTVSVTVLNGSAPIVSINTLMPVDEALTKPVMQDMVHLIPSLTDVILTASIVYTSPIHNIEWFIEGRDDDLSSQSSNASIGNQTMESTVVIPKEILTSKGLYMVGLRVRDKAGDEGEAYEAFTVLPSISGCTIHIPDYEAFQMVTVSVTGCVADDGSYPLSYEVHVYKGSQLISLSPPENHLPMDIMGPPDMLNSSLLQGTNLFSVQICDGLHNCHWFNSSVVGVKAANDLQATAEHAFFMANVAKLKGDYLACLRRHVLYLLAVTLPYRFRHEMEYDSQMAESFLCARMAAEVQCVNPDCFEDLFTFLTPIIIENSPGRDFILMEVVERAVHRMETENISISSVGAQQALLVLDNIFRFNSSNAGIGERVRSLSAAIEKILACSLRLGESSLLTNSLGEAVAALSYTLLNETYQVNLRPTKPSNNQSVQMNFDNSLRDKYSAWECKENSSLCHGIVAEMLFYPDEQLEPPIDIDHNNTVSDVVQLALLNPLTGDPVEGDTWVTLVLTANASRLDPDLRYDCYRWQEEDQGWSREGVDTRVVNDSLFYCGVGQHPSYMAVIGAQRTLSAGEIAGIVLGVLGGVALVGLVGFFFYKKARTKSMRVSISKDVGLELR